MKQEKVVLEKGRYEGGGGKRGANPPKMGEHTQIKAMNSPWAGFQDKP